MILLQRTRTYPALFALICAAACAHTGTTASPALRTDPKPDVATEQAPAAPVAAPLARAKTPPAELYDIAKVVDGDTIWVQRNGTLEKLRLLSVDTEEKISGGSAQANSTKPPTVFGEECALWAQAFFAGLAKDGAPTRVGLSFPNGREQRDFYGRLLCHVILPDGTDYNVMLVEMGKSPYFSKYGWSETEHAAFVAAQKRAQAKKLGIWDPRTNVPATAGVPAAKRPYEKLLAWWDARALAVDSFRSAKQRRPTETCDTDDPVALADAARSGKSVECFGEVAKVDDAGDGAVFVYFRASVKDKALRVRVPKEVLAQHWAFDLRASAQEFHQNYVWVTTRVEANAKGFDATSTDPRAWKLAGPEPR